MSAAHHNTIDRVAAASRLNRVNPALKLFSALGLMFFCVASGPIVGVFLAICGGALLIFGGRLRLRAYVHFLAIPLSFIIISTLALLFDVSARPFGTIRLPIFGVWLCVGASAPRAAALVLARSLGALSCLLFVSLTTSMPEIIGVLRRARCPELFIELMYLIYRYIFILTTMFHTMNEAAKSRLGDITFRARMRTAGSVYANLLARGYRQAQRNFDAMESRCYADRIRFLEARRPILPAHAAVVAAIISITLALEAFI